MFKHVKIVSIVVLILCAGSCSLPAANYYLLANRAAKNEMQEFAFMYYRRILKEHPDSKYRGQALFASGEYYFKELDYVSAQSHLEAYVDEFPQEEGYLFALAQLLVIAQERKSLRQAENLEEAIMSYRKTALVFKDYNEFKYVSPLKRYYKAIFFIDNIKFYVDDQLILQMAY